MVRLELPGSERRYHLEHLVRKAPNVQDVGPLSCLRCLVRLNIQTNQPGIRIPLPEFRPLGQQRSSPASSLVNPGLVIRDEEDQICLRLPLVQKAKRSAAIRAAAPD